MKKNTYITISALTVLACGTLNIHAEKITEVRERTSINQPSRMVSPTDDMMMDEDMEFGMNQPDMVTKTEQRYVRRYDDNNNPVIVRRYVRPVRRYYYSRPYSRRYYYGRPYGRYYGPRRYRRYYDDDYYDDGYYYGRDRAGRVVGGAATGALIGGIAGGGRGAGIGAGVGAGLGLIGP